MGEDKSSTGSLTYVADVFAESLKSPECKEILLNYLGNVERQTKNIYTLAHSTREHQIKGEKQLNDLTESRDFLSDKLRSMKKAEEIKIR